MSHRKMSETDELRVVAEYETGRTAAEISAEPWCTLGREGVNFLLRRRRFPSHHAKRWEGKETPICEDYENNRYQTRDEFAKAYGTSWCTIERILKKNGIAVQKNTNRARASVETVDAQLRNRLVEYSSPFSHTIVRSSLFDAIERMRMFGLLPRSATRRIALRKIRHVLKESGKFAFGYSWREVESL